MDIDNRTKEEGELLDYRREDDIMQDFFRRNGEDMPDVNDELETFRQRHYWNFNAKTTLVAASIAAVMIFAFLMATNWNQQVSDNTLMAYEQVDSWQNEVTITHDDDKEIALHGNRIAFNGRMPQSNKGKVMKTLSTPMRKTFCVILEDNTEVWLNSNSRLRFPDHFDADNRAVEITGEAYFSVAHDAKRPFYVKANGVTTKVLGTEFNICSTSPASTSVTLVEGSLEVFCEPKAVKRIVPGECATFSEGKITVQVVDTYPITAWKRGEFYFDNATLLDIVREIGRWYNVSVVFNNKENATRQLFFSADRYAPLNETAEALSLIGKVKIEVKNNVMTIE